MSDAVEAFKQAIRMKPDFGKAYYNLGRTYMSMKNRDAAVEQYNILQNLDQDWADRLNAVINP
jgi:tetratricopeptide (TPR) repeat protein